MNILSILHATFLVSDLERSCVFYEGVLGLAVDPARPDLGFPGVWYAVGKNQQIHLMQLPDPELGLQRPQHPQGARRGCKGLKPQQHTQHGGRDRHVALAVDDLVELAGRLDAAGVSYTHSRSGRAALFCRDPDGNALEFIGPALR
ncbi:MAG TPA: VOC family protein [Gallionellaceae bacterium]